MKRIVSVIVAAAALAACETAPVGPPTAHAPAATFRENDFAWSTGPGAGRIFGVLAYHDEGRRYTCKGEGVILAPETPWSRARMRALYLSTTSAALPVDEVRARTPPEHGAEYAHYARQTTCDADNHFAFHDLPNGAWYVITVATPLGGGQRIAVMRRVVTDGGDDQVVLR
jgi:hypothetical protein